MQKLAKESIKGDWRIPLTTLAPQDFHRKPKLTKEAFKVKKTYNK
jgi:hypothetical protein